MTRKSKTVTWCLDKAEEAIKNYDADATLNYIKMAKMWNYLRENNKPS